LQNNPLAGAAGRADEVAMNETDQAEFTTRQQNQRRSVRAPLIVEKIPCEDGRKTFFGYAKNLSRGGLFIATVKPREPGEVFSIELSLTTEPVRILRCRCEVVWKRHFSRKEVNEPGMGLRFLDLDDADGEAIDAWVARQTGVVQSVLT
jgi:uncharacterized protein (TIGR02266 family)